MNLHSIKQLVQDVINGDESALRAFAVIKEQAKEVDKCLKEVEPHAIQEAETYNAKNFEAKGYSFEMRQGSRRFNFSSIPKWHEAKAALKSIEDRGKAAFAAYEQKLNTADEDGEIADLPEVTYGKPSLIVKPVK